MDTTQPDQLSPELSETFPALSKVFYIITCFYPIKCLSKTRLCFWRWVCLYL